MKKFILDTLFALTHIVYWQRNHRTDNVLDEWYDKKIKEGIRFTNMTEYCAKFNGKIIWISNQPYACFVVNKAMPKRRTVARLQKLLMISVLEEVEDKSSR